MTTAGILRDPFVLDGIIQEGLSSLYRELSTASWYKRENEIVSLFAFGHLVPVFQRESLDSAVLDIEGRVPQIEPPDAPRGRKDLVIWARRLDSYWRDKKAVGEWERNGVQRVATNWRGDRPFAVAEWKLNDRIGFEADKAWLKANSGLMQVGYAILVERPGSALKLTSVRIQEGKESPFLILPLAAIERPLT